MKILRFLLNCEENRILLRIFDPEINNSICNYVNVRPFINLSCIIIVYSLIIIITMPIFVLKVYKYNNRIKK